MRYEFKPSFERSIKSLATGEKEKIKKVALQTIDILSHKRIVYKGIGLKRLKDNFWEVRKGIKARILFTWQGELVEFILAGDHDDIKRYLNII